MEASEEYGVGSEESPRGRWLRVLVLIGTAIVLSPVMGMILIFAILPALPIALAIGLVLGPINWAEDRDREAEARWGHLPWSEAHMFEPAHAH